MLFISARSKTKASSSAGDRGIPYFHILFALFFFSNVMWVFGFIALLINAEWAWYPHIVLLGSQGLVIFLGFFGT